MSLSSLLSQDVIVALVLTTESEILHSWLKKKTNEKNEKEKNKVMNTSKEYKKKKQKTKNNLF